MTTCVSLAARRTWGLAIAMLAILCAGCGEPVHVEQRNTVSYARGPYNTAFYSRLNRAYRISAAFHFGHSKQHDVLLRTPFDEHERVDVAFDREALAFTLGRSARIEPSQEYYAPYTAQVAWKVLWTIDWTHVHHEQTYDILADADIPWNEKKQWTDRAVRAYLNRSDVAFSVAPLDLTMRRAAVMMKPYFTTFRNYYPRSNNYFYAAHWWHPVIYEAQMIGGNEGQERTVWQTNETFYEQVLQDRPQRMLLLREAAPRYSRMSPESANIFDNLHMFHGIIYDIFAYDGWTIEEKRAEAYRVIDALRHHDGDEELARKFPVPRPNMDPRVYEPWLRSVEGEMNRIMMEMHNEMMPHMMPEGQEMTPEKREQMMTAMRQKLRPGLQEGEHAGSLLDAMRAVMPDMQVDPAATAPGETPQQMVEAMLRAWHERVADMPAAEMMPMDAEPTAPPLPDAPDDGTDQDE